jgi:hypothetical protein
MMVELADRLDGALQLLVVVQPAPHLGNLFAAQAELPSAPAGIADGQNRDRVPLAARTSRAAPAMANDTIERGLGLRRDVAFDEGARRRIHRRGRSA